MLGLMLLGTVVIYIDRNVLGVLAPILKEQLHFSTEQYSYVVSTFQIVYSFSQPVAGFLTDLIGPRIGYGVAALVWGVACALHAFSGGWVSMAGFRALLGLSEAVAMPTGTKTATLWFPSKERSIATGWFNSGSSVGAALTPPLVIWISVTWGWQWAFIITGLLGVALSIAWYLLYRNPENHPRLSDEERLYIADGNTLQSLPKPSIKAVITQKKFLGLVIARFLTEPAWQTFSFWIPLYMVSVRHMDIKEFALFAWLPFFFSDLGCIGGGYLAPFIHKHFKFTLVNSRLTTISFGAVCMVGPALIGMVVSPIAAIFCFALGGFAHQMLSSMMYAVVGDVFEKQEVATATGIAGMFGYLGGALFTLVVGQLANTVGYEPLFAMLFAFDLVAALALWFFIGEWRSRKPVLKPAE
jgi:ACS family hexuronate transporter-like MFS transporter